jgi:hypothetical protein
VKTEYEKYVGKAVHVPAVVRAILPDDVLILESLQRIPVIILKSKQFPRQDLKPLENVMN